MVHHYLQVFRISTKHCKRILSGAALTGWTQVTAHNDKALRLVNGAGGGFGFGGTSGGGSNFSTVFPPQFKHYCQL